jgi:hypothetical protein
MQLGGLGETRYARGTRWAMSEEKLTLFFNGKKGPNR